MLFLACLSLGAWIYLAFYRDDYWRAEARLPDLGAASTWTPKGPADDAAHAWPKIQVVIPARDEAATIAAVVRAHMTCDYPGPLAVTVVDDHSTDGTGERARSAAEPRDDRRLSVIAAPALSPGWTGKLNAMAAGVDAAAAAGSTPPDYFLFTDADILFAPTTLRRLVAHGESHDLALVSLMARLDARGAWGRLLAPAFVYFFQKLFPFPAVNDVARPEAAAKISGASERPSVHAGPGRRAARRWRPARHSRQSDRRLRPGQPDQEPRSQTPNLARPG